MWGQQGAPRGTATYAWLWDPAKGYGSDAVRNVTPTGASGANIPIFCSGSRSSRTAGCSPWVARLWAGLRPERRVHRLGRARRRSRVRPRHRNVGRAASASGVERTLVPDPGAPRRRADTRHERVDQDPPGGVFTPATRSTSPRDAFTLLETSAQRRSTDLYPHLFTMPNGRVLLAGPARADSRFSTRRTSPPRGPTFRSSPRAATRERGPAAQRDRRIDKGLRSAAALQRGAALVRREDRPGRPDSDLGELPAPRRSAQTGEHGVAPGRIDGHDRRRGLGYSSTTSAPSSCTNRSPGAGAPARARSRRGPTTRPRCSCRTGGCSRTATTEPGRGRRDGEVYSPPYLFKGPRAVISSAPAAVRWSVPVGAGTPGEIAARCSSRRRRPGRERHAPRARPAGGRGEHAGAGTRSRPRPPRTSRRPAGGCSSR